MATFKAVVFTGGKHLKQDGTTNIKIRIYHNGVSQYIPTEYYVKPELMGNDGNIVSSSEEGEALNYELTELIQKYRGAYIKLGMSRTSKMSCAELKEEIVKLANPESEIIDFVAFSREIISKTVKRKTAVWYESSLNAFIRFYGSDRIDVKDVRAKKLEDWMTYLANSKVNGSERLMEPGTINNYMRGIRALYNRARMFYNNEDFDIIKIPGNPFVKIRIPEYRRKRKNLKVEDIVRISRSNFDRERTNIARDIFMVQFYLMGINLNDLFNIRREVYGRIEYERSKVNTVKDTAKVMLSVRIEPECREILRKYSNGSFLSFIRDRYTNYDNFLKAVNKELKVISSELNLGVPLSTNWARHSWASIARNKAGISKADVDFCLGHVSNEYKMADIYIETDYSICDRANRAVLDLMKKIS
ncbi:site-specific recombinase XerD [Bacteroides zoogleoformans]|uniref:Transposase n=1 Tax=Bacteroides zoogleoformans TaxID=28119 RepID=A0ABN5IKP6_9BACE|nr:phage integrase SAM-like domain-containing protein [Bacteroides zoogleoformans]AVM53287.1 transposase [Bacteroides zoogleoformans]TWJ14386.1 site-specific recombinase XerD [Bacteroides zoogleoformans]